MAVYSSFPRSAQDLTIAALLHPDSTDDPSGVMRDLIRSRLDGIPDNLPRRRDGTDAGLIDHVGDTVVYLATALGQVIEELTDDRLIKYRTINLLKEEKLHPSSNVNDLDCLSLTHKSHKVLKDMRAAIVESVREIKDTWEKRPREPAPASRREMPVGTPKFSPMSSFSPSSRTNSSVEVGPGNRFPLSDNSPTNLRPNSPGTRVSRSPSNSSIAHPDAADTTDPVDLDMESLKNRGKGSYRCRYGASCTKGGVDANGDIVIFERNCMFRQHMHKHDKPYRCSLSGCPNKDGFARKDQLERHIKNVRHDQVP